MATKLWILPNGHQAWNIPMATKLGTFQWPPSLEHSNGHQVLDLSNGHQALDPSNGHQALDPSNGNQALDPSIGHCEVTFRTSTPGPTR